MEGAFEDTNVSLLHRAENSRSKRSRNKLGICWELSLETLGDFPPGVSSIPTFYFRTFETLYLETFDCHRCLNSIERFNEVVQNLAPSRQIRLSLTSTALSTSTSAGTSTSLTSASLLRQAQYIAVQRGTTLSTSHCTALRET
jgi:hypothetical protein